MQKSHFAFKVCRDRFIRGCRTTFRAEEWLVSLVCAGLVTQSLGHLLGQEMWRFQPHEQRSEVRSNMPGKIILTPELWQVWGKSFLVI